MGWKNLKERFRIEHLVQVTDAGICIGSSYVHNLIVVLPDGSIREGTKIGIRGKPDLERYMQEMTAEPAAVREAITTPDHFERSLTVWTFDGGEIIEKKCEEYGWPNATHDGEMMYQNRYFRERSQCIAYAKKNAEAGREILSDRIAEVEASLADLKNRQAENDHAIALLSSL